MPIDNKFNQVNQVNEGKISLQGLGNFVHPMGLRKKLEDEAGLRAQTLSDLGMTSPTIPHSGKDNGAFAEVERLAVALHTQDEIIGSLLSTLAPILEPDYPSGENDAKDPEPSSELNGQLRRLRHRICQNSATLASVLSRIAL